VGMIPEKRCPTLVFRSARLWQLSDVLTHRARGGAESEA
jgi:hypothetical protein